MENFDPKKYEFSVKYKLPRAQLKEFVDELYRMQEEMIETAVAIKEKQGFPDVVSVINYIKGLK